MNNSAYRLAGPDCRPPAPWTYWVVEGRFLAGSFPTTSYPDESLRRMQTLLDAGIMAFFDLTEEWELVRFGESLVPYPNLVTHLQVSGEVRCERRAILDMSIPKPALMETILNEIDHSLASDSPVYIHCWGGMGRTGTVVGCWLIRNGLATPENVLDVMDQLRIQDEVHGCYESPQTPEQRRFVLDWKSAISD